MKKIKIIFEKLATVIFIAGFTIIFGYGAFFKLVPILWHHGSSYAFEAMFTVIIGSCFGLFYLTGFTISAINDLVETTKPPPSE